MFTRLRATMTNVALRARPSPHMLRFFLALLSASICLLSLHAIYLRHADESLILPGDLLQPAEELSRTRHWAEAKMLGEFVIANPELGDAERARDIVDRSDAAMDSVLGTAERFVHGAVTGEPNDVAGLIGSVSLDLFVIGDIRDLLVQGWKQWQYDEGDTVILSLSAVGLATTLAPHLDWAPALMKSFRRVGALSADFTRQLTTMSRAAVKSGRLEALTATLTDFGRAARRLGPGPLAGVMRQVDDADALKRVADAAAVDPHGTYVLATVFGKTGIERIARGGGNVGALVASIKVGSRAGKTLRKATSVLPTALLASVAAAAALVAVLLLGGAGALRRIAAAARRRREPRRGEATPAGPTG